MDILARTHPRIFVLDTLPSVGNHAISHDGLLRHYSLEISNVPPDPTGSTLPLLCLAYRSWGSVRASMRCLSPAGRDSIEVDKKKRGDDALPGAFTTQGGSWRATILKLQSNRGTLITRR